MDQPIFHHDRLVAHLALHELFFGLDCKFLDFNAPDTNRFFWDLLVGNPLQFAGCLSDFLNRESLRMLQILSDDQSLGGSYVALAPGDDISCTRFDHSFTGWACSLQETAGLDQPRPRPRS